MRNLKVLVNLKHSINTIENSQQFAVSTFDFNNNIFVRKGFNFVYKDGEIFSVSPSDGTCEKFLSLNHLSIKNTNLIALFYNSVLNTLNIALEIGDVLSVPLTEDLTLVNNEVQCVGSIGTGLQAAVLSPDGETLVFLSGDNVVIVMSGNFDPIEETDLFGSDQGEQEMVNVGWGKKETQFHGSEGKAAAKRKVMEETVEFNSDNNIEKPHISWRGDSSLFAINYWCPEKNHKKVKIFDKCGHLQCTSEFLPGLEGLIAWRPSGNLIALAQKLPNKHVICFMEKNGLRHGDFTLSQNIKVLELCWNCESTILSAVCIDESVNQPCVLMWTTGNYHWYLKQKLVFASPVVGLRWDDVIGNLVHILLADGTFLVHQWTWSVDHSAGLADNDLAVVAVIDGSDVKLSAFKKCVIPPPMCGATLSLPCPILQVCFAPYCGQDGNSGTEAGPNDLFVYLSDGRLGIIKGVETSPQLQGILPLEWSCTSLSGDNPASFSHWTWLSSDQLICVVHCGSSHLCHVQLGEKTAAVLSTLPVEEPVLTISHRSGSSSVLVQLCSGDVLIYGDGTLTPFISLPEPCIALCCIGAHTFARAHNNHMYVDGESVATNVTSFFCLPRFLVMTLSSHQLCIASAQSGFKIQEVGEGEGQVTRRVERGSRLVVCVGHCVVLQMPRGNLETLEPRALTLVTAAELLDAGDYKTVAQLLRRQRINLNLCVDHNPTAFLLSVPRFVAQVRDPQWLSVFLAELSEQDVTRGMYKGFYSNQAGRGPPLADKVKRVCSALREAMTASDEEKARYQQPILSSLVREGRVGDAIALADCDQAINYLVLLLDTDRLYEEALGTYNLDKALKIAGKSLKDPKEYVAYLNELRQMDPAYMRFTIDKRRRKPESALRNLAQCTDRTGECLQYVEDTELYNLALDLFKDQPDMYQKICFMYGSWLLKHQRPQEAGLMLSRGGDVAGAIAAYTRASCWRQCLTLASLHGYSDSAVAEDLYSALVGRQQHTEAAEMCQQLGWYEKAIRCWVDAHCWSQAVYLCHTHKLVDLLESTVRPELLDSQSRTVVDLRTKCSNLDKHSQRLLVVREKKANLDNNYDAMSDIQSDTSSLSSFTTSSTGTRTTKNTRKAQRKLWSLKEGNPREEQALLYTITELIQNTERLTGEVQSTCLALAEFGLDVEARSLHSTMATAIERITKVKHSVWPTSAIKKTGSDADAVDPTAIDTQLNYPPVSCTVSSWKLNIFS